MGTKVRSGLYAVSVFGEASYQFDDRWELTLGGRYFDYEREDVQTNKLAELEAGLNPVAVDASKEGNILKANIILHQ